MVITNDPRVQQSERAPSPAWYYFPLTVLLAAACSVVLRLLQPSSSMNPFMAVSLLFLWWTATSYVYLRLSLGKSLSGPGFLHWLLLTPRLRLCCLAALGVGMLFSTLFGNVLPLFVALGLIWPAFFAGLGQVRGVCHGAELKLLVVGSVVIWLLSVMAMNFATDMRGIVNASDQHAIPNPCAWLALAYHGPGPWYQFFHFISDALLATLFFQGGWLASGSAKLASTLPLALPAGERAAANSLLIHSVLYWGKLIIVTSLAYVVARGPLYAHPLPALLLAIAVTAAAHLLAQTRPLRRLLACGIGTGELGQQPATTSRAARVLFPLLGLLILAGCLLLLERHDPYFFTQNDAFSLGTPLALHACRSLWRGVFCTWNPYQFMGLPIASNPQSFYAYPPLYLAYFLARQLLGHEYALNDVFVLLHIFAAYGALYWWARYLGMRPILAMACALSFVLSGYVLVLGRCWATVLISCCWVIPLGIAVTLLHRRRVGLHWVLGTGAALGCAYYVGFPQGWCYSVGFFLVAVLILFAAGSLSRAKLLYAVAALLLGVAICLPILVPQMQEVKRFYAARVANSDCGLQRAFTNMLLPYPLAKLEIRPDDPANGNYSMAWGGRVHQQYRGQLYYSGTCFLVIMLALLLASTALRWSAPRLAANVWFLCAVLAFILCLGPPGVLWNVQQLFPLLAKFRGTMKMLGYLNLFAAVGAGVMAERWLRAARRPALPATLFTLLVCALLIYHCRLPQAAFTYFHDKPYPAMPPALAAQLELGSRIPQRVLAEGSELGSNPVLNLKSNFASLYGAFTFRGYDPLLEMTPEVIAAHEFMRAEPAHACQVYGIRWLLVEHYTSDANENPHPLADTPPAMLADFLRNYPGAQPGLRLPLFTIWELPHPDPLAFAEGDPSRPLPLTVNGQGVTVDLAARATPGAVVVNFLHQPWMKAFVDGKPAAVGHDRWGRMLVRAIPAGAHTLAVKYIPPWPQGFLAGALLLLVAIGTWRLAVRAQRREGEGRSRGLILGGGKHSDAYCFARECSGKQTVEARQQSVLGEMVPQSLFCPRVACLAGLLFVCHHPETRRHSTRWF